MTRVKLAIDTHEEYTYSLAKDALDCDKEYSLSRDEYSDYLSACVKWRAWQNRLQRMRPDDYVEPPPYVPTKEQIELRAFQESDAYLDRIAPIP